jgi:hypothetical protein
MFSLKGEGEDGPPQDFRLDETAQLLGFTLAETDGGLHLDLGEDAWLRLKQRLENADRTKTPADTAINVVYDWINASRWALENCRGDILMRVPDTAALCSFREATSFEKLLAG